MRNLPITDLGSVLRLDSCQKQKDMCWDYEGFVLAYKKVNPDFDPEKPFVVVINIPGAVRGERDGWQLHFENFGDMPKDAKAFDDMYKAVAASCPAGRSLYLSGGCTPGGIAGLSKLEDYGFKKEWLPYGGSIVYWGGDVIDPGKFDKWLNGGRHDGDFLVKEWSEDGEWVLRPPEQGDELTEQNTQPRPFKMVRTSAAVNENVENEKTMKTYTKKQITEAIAYWEKRLEKMNEVDNVIGEKTPVPDTVGEMIEFLKKYPAEAGFTLNFPKSSESRSGSRYMDVDYWGEDYYGDDRDSPNNAILEITPL